MTDDERATLRLQVLQLLAGRGTRVGVIEQLPELDQVVRWVLLGEVPEPDAPAPGLPGLVTTSCGAMPGER